MYTKKVRLESKHDDMQGKFPVLVVTLFDLNKGENLKPKKVFKTTQKGSPTALSKALQSMDIGTVFTGEFDPDRYHNLVRIEDIQKPSGGPPPSQQSAPQSTGGQRTGGATGGGGYGKGAAQFRDPDEISRTECLKEAINIEIAYLNREGMHKKTVKSDVVDGNILERAETFFKYIKGELKVGDPTSTAKDLGNPEDLDQPPVDDEGEEDIPY